MTAPLIGPASFQWLGIARETNYGVAAAAPTVWVPVTSPKWAPHITPLKDSGLRGSMAATFQQVGGVRFDTVDYAASLYLDSIMLHMIAILGGADAVTGAGDPWTHKTSLLNTGQGQPTSYTLWMANNFETWRMVGAQLASLDVETKVADSLTTITPSWMGLPATSVSAPTNTPTTLKPAPSWNTLVTIGGTATANYSDVKLSLKRDAEAVFAANQTQAPYVIFVGALTVTGSLVAVYQGLGATPSDLANYLANTQPALLLQNNPAGDAVHFAKWQHTQVAYDDVAIADNGKYLEVTSNLEAIANSTDATNSGLCPELFTLLSPVSAAF